MTTTVRLVPDSVNLEGYAGDTLSLRVTATGPAVVEGGTWLAQVRETHDGEVVATFTAEPEGTGTGSVLLTLPADVTAALGGGFAGQWDVQATTGEVVRTLVRGKLALSYDITRTP